MFPDLKTLLVLWNIQVNDPGITFNDFSPRIGATYDFSGDGKTIIRGNFARYYDGLNPAFTQLQNPTFVYNGAIIPYTQSEW